MAPSASSGNGGAASGRTARRMSANGLSSPAMRLTLTAPQPVQRCTSAHSPPARTETAIGSIAPAQAAAQSPGTSASTWRLHRQLGQWVRCFVPGAVAGTSSRQSRAGHEAPPRAGRRGACEPAMPAAERVAAAAAPRRGALIARQEDLRGGERETEDGVARRGPASAGAARRGVFRGDSHQVTPPPPWMRRGMAQRRGRPLGPPGGAPEPRTPRLCSAVMVATVVATPVIERLSAGEAAGVVRGATDRAAYVDLGGFVVALTAPGVPLMPNGIAVARTALGDGAVRAAPGRIALAGGPGTLGARAPPAGAGGAVTWDAGAPPGWEPALAPFGAADAAALRARGAAIGTALGPWELGAGERGRQGLAPLGPALGRPPPR